ncbi:MAG: hypothetical protein ABL882_01395 [Sphingopyxis sp.]
MIKISLFSRAVALFACVGLMSVVPDFVVPASPAAAQSASDGCEAPRRSAGRGIGRSILGNVLGNTVGRAGGAIGNIARFAISSQVTDALTNAIACRLDEPEQLKAKDATLEATRSETVGTQVAWTSETRADVSGTTTIAAIEDRPAGRPQGSRCMLVDDVIIVNGEETVAQKRMCRVPPETRYALA